MDQNVQQLRDVEAIWLGRHQAIAAMLQLNFYFHRLVQHDK